MSSFALSHIEAEAIDAGGYAEAISSREFRARFVHYSRMIEDRSIAEGISRVLGRIARALNAGENFTLMPEPERTLKTNPLINRLKADIIEGVFDAIIPCNETDPKQVEQMGKVIKAIKEGRNIVLVSPNLKQAAKQIYP